MKTKVGEFDLQEPQVIWGLDGYDGALLAVRRGAAVLGTIWLSIRAGQHIFTVADLVSAAKEGSLSESEISDPLSFPPISIVVCSRDRPVPLKRCLRALQGLIYPEFEVVVVDNASRGAATLEVVEDSGFRYVREDRPGLDWARNRGFHEAKYDLIAYVDDDAIVDRHWLGGWAQAFQDPDVKAATGLVLPWELETRAQHLFERYGGMGKGFVARTFRASEMTAEQTMDAHHLGVGANMAFRREALALCGPFDTALDVGTVSQGGGDVDMFHRVLIEGWALKYEPGALVWHQHRRDIASLKKQIYSNGRAFGVYLIKIWRAGQVPRRVVAAYAWRWVRSWLIFRTMRGILGRGKLPWWVPANEIWGASHSFYAYIQTYRCDRLLRARFGGGPVCGTGVPR
ncbi:glycosyltransferase family 2 protein [Thiocapsa marina]|uniref:Glycosyl transferase family 2 n=1 Tax=Thiocapsa marina 5811 TaxID=768671 RepID=F9UAT5_9GAMM|nr:glycosyltransferase [Thiocapsa marina]EGV18553.1 glycosyl transferase family 2 [Thiocapsa marina 5811]